MYQFVIQTLFQWNTSSQAMREGLPLVIGQPTINMLSFVHSILKFHLPFLWLSASIFSSSTVSSTFYWREPTDFSILLLYIYLFFGSNLLCLRDIPYVTHLVHTQGTNQAWPRLQEPLKSPPPPLSGGSLRGQAFPACFKHAPQYNPET